MPVDVCRRNNEDAAKHAIRFERRLASWEVGEPELRIIQIGGELSMASAPKFRQKFPEALEWLASQGCSEAEAVRRFQAALAKESTNPFWRTAKNVKKRAVKKKTTRRIKEKHGGIHDHSGNGDTSGPGPGDDSRPAAEPRSGGE